MKYLEIETKHKKIIDIAKSYMEKICDSEHDINHIMDVVNYTKEILEKIDDVDKEVCIISAYFHDVGRIKQDSGHEKISAEILKDNLIKNGYDEEFANKCFQAIQNHKWNMNPETKEGLVVKDADKLAWIGKGRWLSCLNNNKNLDEIIELLPKLRNDILYFDVSKEIYDRDIVELIKILYSKCK